MTCFAVNTIYASRAERPPESRRQNLDRLALRRKTVPPRDTHTLTALSTALDTAHRLEPGHTDVSTFALVTQRVEERHVQRKKMRPRSLP